ncbi:hypothetical protein [Cohnella panacarvi]|uniref:hypothetical protein n=1 Tax=Cohnella panacarvi TaxID=400776 RepID=UPI00047CEEA5|nr:hypothetical protein [Cohnella panacarvi]
MRRFGISFAAALLSGLLFGVLLRVVMGIIALAYPEMASGFHWEALLMLTVLGMLFTLGNSLIFTCVMPVLPDRWATRGLSYGVANAAVIGTPFFLSNPGGELFGPQAFLGVSLFTLLFVWGGVSLSWTVDKLERWVAVGRIGRTRFTYASFIVLIVPAIIILFNIGREMFTEIIPEIRNHW